MSSAKVRYRRRKRLRQAQAWAREAQRWAPMTAAQHRGFWKLVNFGAGFQAGFCGARFPLAKVKNLLTDWHQLRMQ